jgi:hypothetical protein
MQNRGYLGYTSFSWIARLTFLSFFVFFFMVGTGRAQPLPDLVVTDLGVNSECQMVVTLKNQGTGELPIAAYDPYLGPSVQFYKGSSPFGGWSLSSLDPRKALKSPGGTVSWVRESPKIEGTVEVRVVVDPNNLIQESSKDNNSLTMVLTCAAMLPDLRIDSIEFTSDCRAMLRLSNAGDASLSDAAFIGGNAYLQRYLDDKPAGQIYLGAIDPGKALKPPGGTREWTDGNEYKANKSVKYQIESVGQEKDTSNNMKQVDVPERCQAEATQVLPDLTITDLTVDDQCRVVVTIKNNGPGPLPISAYDQRLGPSVQFYKDNKPFGGWSLSSADPGRKLKIPGNSVAWTRGELKFRGQAEVRVVVNKENTFAESDEANNSLTKTLTCAPKLPDLAITGIDFTSDCRAKILFQNLGDVEAPDSLFIGGYAYVQRYIDDSPGGHVFLNVVDPQKTLKKPGASREWIDGPEFKAKKRVKYTLMRVGQEKDEANNLKQVDVPARCQSRESAPSSTDTIKVPLQRKVPARQK